LRFSLEEAAGVSDNGYHPAVKAQYESLYKLMSASSKTAMMMERVLTFLGTDGVPYRRTGARLVNRNRCGRPRYNPAAE